MTRKDLAVPPINFTAPVPPVDADRIESDISSDLFYHFSSARDTVRKFSSVMSKNRLHFVRQLEKHSRSQEMARKAEQRTKELNDLSPDSLQKFLTSRHEWKTVISRRKTPDSPICAVPSCSAVALTGSVYCLHHINRDAKQQLFVMCDVCGRPFPKAGACLMCPGKN